MLLSPAVVHSHLSSTLVHSVPASSSSRGPHTALLILPQGRLLCCATNYNDPFPNSTLDEEAIAPNDDAAGDQAGTSRGRNDSSTVNDDEDGAEDGEGPYLDEPERIRILCGLGSNWEEDGVEKVECEGYRAADTLGRLLITPIQLPPAEPSTIMTQNLPASKPISVREFVLLLNAGSDTPWAVLVEKANEFKASWAKMP